MNRALSVALVGLAACGPIVGSDDDGATTTGGGETAASGEVTTGVASGSASAATTATTVSTSGPVTAGTDGDGSTGDACEDEGPKFDIGPIRSECDVFAQDCEPGSKCIPDPFGGHYATCQMIVPDPLPAGDACDGWLETDPCDATSVCAMLDGAGLGTCTTQCTGSADDPLCPDGSSCTIAWREAYALCGVECDPLADAPCASGHCTPTPHTFGCVPDGEALEGQWCSEPSACAEGYACIAGALVPGCCDDTCCSPLCAFAPSECERGQSCQPLEPPIPGFDELGACANNMP
jgi:hypothetical protein